MQHLNQQIQGLYDQVLYKEQCYLITELKLNNYCIYEVKDFIRKICNDLYHHHPFLYNYQYSCVKLNFIH